MNRAFSNADSFPMAESMIPSTWEASLTGSIVENTVNAKSDIMKSGIVSISPAMFWKTATAIRATEASLQRQKMKGVVRNESFLYLHVHLPAARASIAEPLHRSALGSKRLYDGQAVNALYGGTCEVFSCAMGNRRRLPTAPVDAPYAHRRHGDPQDHREHGRRAEHSEKDGDRKHVHVPVEDAIYHLHAVELERRQFPLSDPFRMSPVFTSSKYPQETRFRMPPMRILCLTATS